MKKTLLIMVMALAVLLTQCRKPEVKFPSPVAPEGTTVSMTVTAGPGSKTDITTAGGITWSTGDKLYVGDGSKYIGYLTIVSGVGTPTGTFSGDVTLTSITEGTPHTFGFYYLGRDNGVAPSLNATTVDVSFATQEIYADANSKLANASKHHVGYGSASGTVKDGVVTGINVTLVSKVALARFSFTEDGTGYSNALTLSGTNIYKDMTVNFGGTFTGKTEGDISLTGSHGERYVMLVPTGDATEQTLTFAGGSDEGEGKVPGLESNKFYGKTEPIAVTLTAPTPASVFTVNKASGTKVTFAPGNLYYDGTAGKWKFESNQWDFRTYNDGTKEGGSCIGGVYNASSGTPSGDWGLFGWSGSTGSATYGMSTSTSNSDYSGETLKDWGTAPGLPSAGEGKTWRTLTDDEWKNLLGKSGGTSLRDNAASLRAWVTLDNGVKGLVILPDGSEVTASSVTTTALVASSGAVFLPAAGYRDGTSLDFAGSSGCYWSSLLYPSSTDSAFERYFGSSFAGMAFDYTDRYVGYTVRPVRDSESGDGSANDFTGGTW